MSKPTLLFWRQHSVGLGHLARALALAGGLRERFRVVLLAGGEAPPELAAPEGVEVVELPPLGHDDGYELISRQGADVAAVKTERIRLVLDAYRRTRPQVLLVELYPFGRKKFAFELAPLLEAAHASGPGRPAVVCSVRDILVQSRRDQAAHDERAALAVNRWFDAVLVHADARFATLEQSFRPATPLAKPVHYTGFVHAGPPGPAAPGGEAAARRILVSAGGGLVGGPLLLTALAAQPAVRRATGLDLELITGPFLPAEDARRLRAEAAGRPGVRVSRFTPDLCAAMAASAASLSQCGYNTTMDVLRAGVPALVAPYAEGREDEQRRRAERLAELGALRVLPPERLNPDALAAALIELEGFSPCAAAFDLDGVRRSVELLAGFV
ncbi:MAG: glycosyltransferase family protein [Acidimicrobiales bacterium]